MTILFIWLLAAVLALMAYLQRRRLFGLWYALVMIGGLLLDFLIQVYLSVAERFEKRVILDEHEEEIS